MVWSFSWDPLGSCFPEAEIIDGHTGLLELVEDTPDGGVALRGGSTAFSGRRAKSETVPKKIKWQSRQKIGDFCGSYVCTISERLRLLIEEIEPEVHQFEPVEFVAKDGLHLENRWFWQICNRIDSVNREKTKMILKDGLIWAADFTLPKEERTPMIFDPNQIGGVKIWHDKHVGAGSFCTNEVREKLDAAKMTGFHFRHFEMV